MDFRVCPVCRKTSTVMATCSRTCGDDAFLLVAPQLPTMPWGPNVARDLKELEERIPDRGPATIEKRSRSWPWRKGGKRIQGPEKGAPGDCAESSMREASSDQAGSRRCARAQGIRLPVRKAPAGDREQCG